MFRHLKIPGQSPVRFPGTPWIDRGWLKCQLSRAGGILGLETVRVESGSGNRAALFMMLASPRTTMGSPYSCLFSIPYHSGLSVGDFSWILISRSALPNPSALPVQKGILVKVLLRNTASGWFYQGQSRWTPRQQEALDLGQLAWAVELVFRENLEHVEILLAYEDPQHDVVLPVERHHQKDDRGEGSFLPGEDNSKERGKRNPPL